MNEQPQREKRRPAWPSVRFLRIAVVVLLIVLLGGAGFTWRYWGIRTDTRVRSRTVDFGLRDIGELATQVGYFTNVQVIDKDKKVFNISVPFTGSKYIFSYDGIIKAGYDFSRIELQRDDQNRTITVTLPKAQIFSCEIDTDSLVVYDQSRNVYSPLTVEDLNDSIAAMRVEVQQKAIDNGIFENAYNNASVLIRTFLREMTEQAYTIDIREAESP